MTRIDQTFTRLRAEGRKAFVAYVMGGDPDAATTAEVLAGLPAAGVDIIELGMPFTDPMADGPTIQLAGQRALEAGMTMDRVLDLVRGFRKQDNATPIVLMGYYNPIYSRGVDRFLAEAKEAGIDGLIVVDLPPEEDEELCIPAQAAGINFIRLATPTTDDKRLPKVLQNTSGFVYYVSVTGITGAAAAQAAEVGPEVARIKRQTDLPVIVGFGITTPEAARQIAGIADGCVVGSAIVKEIGAGKHAFKDGADGKDVILEDHHRFGALVFPGVKRLQGIAEQLLQGDGSMSFVKVWQEIQHFLSPWRRAGCFFFTPNSEPGGRLADVRHQLAAPQVSQILTSGNGLGSEKFCLDMPWGRDFLDFCFKTAG